MRKSDRRGYLALARLEEFATWCEALGYAKEDPTNEWEVLRMRGPEGTVVVWQRAGATVHGTVSGLSRQLAERFVHEGREVVRLRKEVAELRAQIAPESEANAEEKLRLLREWADDENTKSIGDVIIDRIIKGNLVRTDDEEPTVLVWSANAPEQLSEFVMRAVRIAKKHALRSLDPAALAAEVMDHIEGNLEGRGVINAGVVERALVTVLGRRG